MTTHTSTALVETPQNTLPQPEEWNLIVEISKVLHASQFLPNSIRTPQQAATIVLKGRELGIPAMQSFSHIHVIEGKPSCSAELQLALLARGGVTWTWLKDGTEADGYQAIIEFHRPGYKPAQGKFTQADAMKAKKKTKDGFRPMWETFTWQQYPANMLRARAISNGARMIAPDLLAGMSYTPEELGADVNEEGAPLEVEAVVTDTTPPTPPTQAVEQAPKSPPDPASQDEAASDEKAPYFRFLEKCQALKTSLIERSDKATGEGLYYAVLESHQLKKSNEVHRADTQTMSAIVNELELEALGMECRALIAELPEEEQADHEKTLTMVRNTIDLKQFKAHLEQRIGQLVLEEVPLN